MCKFFVEDLDFFCDACLDTIGPEQQVQMLVQYPTEASPSCRGEAYHTSKLGIVTDSTITRWQQGRGFTEPFPFSWIEINSTVFIYLYAIFLDSTKNIFE